ncbi:MAG: queuosine precursor transporter [Pseudomonadota bacterium]
MSGSILFSRTFAAFAAAMAFIVVASNVLVQHPFTPWGLQDYLTWGAFTYPIAFLVTDLSNRRFGPDVARRVVLVGFVIAVALSIVFATPRIALASGTAFLTAHLLDIFVFNRLRTGVWWRAPLISSTIGSALDTVLFFSLAFAGAGIGTAVYPLVGEAPVWAGWAFVDFLVKLVVALTLLIPFRAMIGVIAEWRPETKAANGSPASS